MPLSLSGYLPDDEHDGLTRFAPELVRQFEAQYGRGDVDVTVVVVGVLHVETLKHNRDPEKKPPVPELRFDAIEGVSGKKADQLRWVVAALRSSRRGETTLDGFDEAVTAMLEGRPDVPPPPPERIVHDVAGGSATDAPRTFSDTDADYDPPAE